MAACFGGLKSESSFKQMSSAYGTGTMDRE